MWRQNYEQILPYSGSVVKGTTSDNPENFKLDKASPCDKMILGHCLFCPPQRTSIRPVFCFDPFRKKCLPLSRSAKTTGCSSSPTTELSRLVHFNQNKLSCLHYHQSYFDGLGALPAISLTSTCLVFDDVSICVATHNLL
jgi:hypothetical protein